MEAFAFMNPRRRLRHSIQLAIGYVLVGIALLLLTTVLLFVAYGFGLKDGRVIQSGLLFLSSTPSQAQIYINGERYHSDTNTKAVLPEGSYQVTLKRSGYRDWSRTISVQGGAVESYVYPFFFPRTMTAVTAASYAAAPSFVSQSPDHRWLLVNRPGTLGSFDLYDLTSAKLAPSTLTIPAGVIPDGTTSLTPVAWANDNQHLLLQTTGGPANAYLLFDRQAPDHTLNLTKTLSLAAGTTLSLRSGAYDHYFAFNSAAHELDRVSLAAPVPTPYLKNVLAFAADGDTVLYAAPDSLDAQKVTLAVYDGTNSYVIRRAKVSPVYLLALTHVGNTEYAAMSATSEGVAFIYQNPFSQLTNQQLGIAVPAQVLSIKNPTSVSFSTNGQYVAFESGSTLATYDDTNDQAFTFQLPGSLDAPQAAASWMDGARLMYVSHGQVAVCDYDGQNCQQLVPGDARYQPYFDPAYKTLYVFVASAADHSDELLTAASLRTAADR